MVRGLLWTLRQRRYAALAATMLAVAVACAAAGSFELHRYREKVHANSELRANAHAPVVPLAAVPVTVSDGTDRPVADSARVTYRRVTVSGTYLSTATTYLTDQMQDGRQGFAVLTPLRTGNSYLLVARGFVAATETLQPPAAVPVAPAGTVTVSGWLRPSQQTNDKFQRGGPGEVSTVNAARQAARLGRPVYDAYATLDDAQPGTGGLAVLQFPSLSNPSGGAEQWQLAAYVVQWYTFAVLALLAPFLISRAEVREARRRFLGIDDATEQFDSPAISTPGLAALTGAGSLSDEAGALQVRPDRTLARPADVVARRWNSALRLSDRYGRSLGPDATADLVRGGPQRSTPTHIRDSRARPHRSGDDYHGSYNDLLWELALADGEQPAGADPEVLPPARPQLDLPRPRPIELDD